MPSEQPYQGIQPPQDSSTLEIRLLGEYMTSKAISLTYLKLVNNAPNTVLSVRDKWSSDLGELNDDDWMEALASPKESAIRSRFRLVQLKVLHRVYYTPVTLKKMGRLASGECHRGCGTPGTFFHVIWSCTELLVGYPRNYYRSAG